MDFSFPLSQEAIFIAKIEKQPTVVSDNIGHAAWVYLAEAVA